MLRLPLLPDLPDAFPIPHGQPRQVGGAQRRGLRHAGTDDLRREQVGLELHQQVVARRPAVDLQFHQRDSGVALHRAHDVQRLVGDALQRRAGYVRSRRSAADAADRAPGVLVPVRGRQSRQRGHEVDASGVGNRRRQRLHLRRGADDPQPVAQPLHHRSADEDAPFEGVVDLVADLPGDGRQQVVFRGDGLFAAVHQQEAARAVGVFHRSRLDAHLSEQGRLLVAGDTRDGDFVGEDRGFRRSVNLARRAHLGHHRRRNVEQLQQLLVPLQRADVEQHRA